MPRPSTSTLSSPRSSRSVFSHWITVRSGIAAFSTGTSSDNRPLEITKPPTCCDKCRGKSEYFPDQVQEPFDNRAFGIEPGFEDTAVIDTLPIPPLHRTRQTPDLQITQAQRLADISECTAWPIGNDRGRERRTLPAVLCIDVLNDFFATFVLESPHRCRAVHCVLWK